MIQMRSSVLKVKKMADDYELLKPVRYAFMDSDEEMAPGVFCTEYSNGIKVIVDYNRETFEICNK